MDSVEALLTNLVESRGGITQIDSIFTLNRGYGRPQYLDIVKGLQFFVYNDREILVSTPILWSVATMCRTGRRGEDIWRG